MKHTTTMKAWVNTQETLNHPENSAHHAPGSQEHDFNIVSNKYISNHDDKEKMDHEACVRLAASKFWQTHEYNTITGEFCDPQKESEYLRTSQLVSEKKASMPESAISHLASNKEKEQ